MGHTVTLVQQQFQGCLSSELKRLSNGGQGRRKISRSIHIVVAHHGDVARHRQPVLLQGSDKPQSDEIVGCEDRFGQRVPGQQLLGCLVCGFGCPVGGVQYRRGFQVGHCQRLSPSDHASFGIEPVHRPGDVNDGSVTQLNQMFGGSPCPKFLIDPGYVHIVGWPQS